MFVEQVEQIVWRYKLAPETTKLARQARRAGIQVFAIQLEDTRVTTMFCAASTAQCSSPSSFELTQGQGAGAKTQVVAAYKRPSEADAANWVCSVYFESGWMPASVERAPLPLALDPWGTL